MTPGRGVADGDFTTKSTDRLVNREGYVLTGENAAHAKRLDVPESGGEIAMDARIRSPWPSLWGRARRISFADWHHGAPAQDRARRPNGPKELGAGSG